MRVQIKDVLRPFLNLLPQRRFPNTIFLLLALTLRPDVIATCKRHTAWLDKQMAGLMLQLEDVLKHRIRKKRRGSYLPALALESLSHVFPLYLLLVMSESYDKLSERFKRCAVRRCHVLKMQATSRLLCFAFHRLTIAPPFLLQDPTVFQESERPAYEPWWDDGAPNSLTVRI